MPPPRSSAHPQIDCAESTGSPYFPHSRFGHAAYWTEERDLALHAEAARTGGVVTTSILRKCGFSKPVITAAVRRGFLKRWGRGIYLVGPLTDDLTEARAAALAVPHGTLGFDVGAQLARIGPIAEPPLSVIVPPGHRADRKGLRIHRIDLSPRDVTRLRGLPVTTPSVTIVHLARTLPQIPFERVVQEAFAKRLTSTKQLAAALDRHRGGRGTGRLKRMLELGIDDLRSKAEHSLRHWVRQAHDRDHRKEQFLLAQGIATRRFTAVQAIDEPVLVIAGIAAALATQKR